MNTVIFTSYFSVKEHPNNPNDNAVIGRGSDGRVLQNNFEYISAWYNSIINIGVSARIFYDNLTEDFIKKYTTDKIQFIKVNISDYSNNDWRFFCYRNYLENNNFDSVFLTDGSDVKVVKNPSLILSEYPDTDLFVCKDSITLGQFPYCQLHQQVGWDNLDWFIKNKNNLPLINMGVIGGSYSNIQTFLDAFCTTRIRLGAPEFNSDMWIGQYVFRQVLSYKKNMIGEPFTSNFKSYEDDRTDVYFIHK
jgi:hypothetical protein